MRNDLPELKWKKLYNIPFSNEKKNKLFFWFLQETASIKTETADGGLDMVNVGRIQALCWLRARRAAVSVEGGKKNIHLRDVGNRLRILDRVFFFCTRIL